MFEQASRLKLRFPSTKGNLTAEDLWDLPMTMLDQMAIAQHKAIEPEVSFINTAQTRDVKGELKFEILKHVISTRLNEQEIARKKKEQADQVRHIDSLIAKKQDEQLSELSVEELMKLKSKIKS